MYVIYFKALLCTKLAVIIFTLLNILKVYELDSGVGKQRLYCPKGICPDKYDTWTYSDGNGELQPGADLTVKCGKSYIISLSKLFVLCKLKFTS